jgi:hypothetical protein
MMGDFNAKVGCNNEDVKHVMGKHGTGDCNENGELVSHTEPIWLVWLLLNVDSQSAAPEAGLVGHCYIRVFVFLCSTAAQ